MARLDQFTFFALASLPAVRGTRLLHFSDTPTRTETADGTTYRVEFDAVLGCAVVTKVGNRISRTEPVADSVGVQAAPAGTPTAAGAQEGPPPANARQAHPEGLRYSRGRTLIGPT